MAVAYSSILTATASNASSITLGSNITISGTDPALVCCLGNNGNTGTEAFTTVTWDVPSPEPFSQAVQASGNSFFTSAIYVLSNPSGGPDTVTANLGASVDNINMAVVLVTGAHQTTASAIGNTQSSVAVNTSPSVTLTSVDPDDLCIDSLCVDEDSGSSATLSPGANQTERAEVESGGSPFHLDLGVSTQDGSDGGVMSWTLTASDAYVLTAVVIKPAPSATEINAVTEDIAVDTQDAALGLEVSAGTEDIGVATTAAALALAITAITADVAIEGVQASLSREVQAITEDIAVDTDTATISTGLNIDAVTADIAIDTQAATLALENTISANTADIAIDTQAAALSLNLTGITTDIAVDTQTANLTLTIAAGTEDIAVESVQATVTSGVTINAVTEDIAIEGNPATLALQIGANTADIAIDTPAAGLTLQITAITADVAIDTQAATFSFENTINAVTEDIAIESVQANITQGTTINAVTEDIAIDTQTAGLTLQINAITADIAIESVQANVTVGTTINAVTADVAIEGVQAAISRELVAATADVAVDTQAASVVLETVLNANTADIAIDTQAAAFAKTLTALTADIAVDTQRASVSTAVLDLGQNIIATLPTVQYFRGDTNPAEFTRLVNGSAINITGFTYLLTVSRLNSPLASEAAANQIMQLTGTPDADQVNNIGVYAFVPDVTDYNTILESEYELVNGHLVASFWYDIQELALDGVTMTTFGKGVFQVLMDITK